MSTRSETGHGSMRERAEEVGRLLNVIRSNEPSIEAEDDRDFYLSMKKRYEEYGDNLWVSPGQLFWLRDIADKLL